ncbi:RNA polymerase sigma factor [Terriglobus saanensis]|uniref:RNA polymerase, sigma-24 subunit, ECF subfamily n=1 Tax=Terriglobus saanensis (strain ATCC BAA-1853 / DSM 23119 / SP1PR4) TaxID=401053 RepID=E8V572_TERSS|nr:RNA polymerase sigma factor [Terriglobus saanensis]ADV83759.1 RNA polymerase, sigma-24 subunit, ECF subfamily [Terriglobus saanensis SP1PR4]
MSSSPANTAVHLLLRSSAKEKTDRSVLLQEEVLDLFDLMRTRLLGYALSFGISLQDGEDIVQETFLALFRHLLQERPRQNLQGWLFRVVHNLALKRRQKNAASALPFDFPEIENSDFGLNPEELVLFNERHRRLQSALDALPQVDQSCLRLRAEGLRYREISKILGISLGSVSASLTRSLARLERVERR